MESKSLFWADQIAEQILTRNKFRYLGKPFPKIKNFVVKTSASLSGVLHIGRLSDTIRSESVFRALKDAGAKAELIWVAEDMDPLRKVPEGVPKDFEKYIGMSVTDIPDPHGCHKSYAVHHAEEYFKVIDEFVQTKMKKFSMREEYEKGKFKEFIKLILKNMEVVREIQNKYRSEELARDWSPWTPVCKNCGKIITPRVQKFEAGKVLYVCKDYDFEKTTAKGCGFEGEADPLKDDGKLLWKSEWASQWVHWGVVSEGAGKEYQVPNSAFWINTEICERVFGWPSPEPIFYEHLMIDGKKMSASLGNVVYPSEWLNAAEPELLRFFYNKKLMKTRSFSWKELPMLFEDYERCQNLFFGKAKVENEKEAEHMKRLYEISQLRLQKKIPPQIPYTFASMVSQIVPREKMLEKAIALLKATGHISGKLSEDDKKMISHRLERAKFWAENYAPDEYKIKLLDEPSSEIISQLSEKQKSALRALWKDLAAKTFSEKELYARMMEISKSQGLEAKEFFSAAYLVLLGKLAGPRLAQFILAIGQDEVVKRLEKI